MKTMKTKTLQFKNCKLEKKDLFYNQRSKIWYGAYYVNKGKWDNSWAAAHVCRILYTTDIGSIHWGNPIYKGVFTLMKYRVFLLFTASNSKALGLLSAFPLQVMQNQKQIRAELHRFKFNQGTKNPKQIQKELLCRR